MQVAILDGYIDEPACLGVPPYISPHVRYLAGAVKILGLDYEYLTIDEYRRNTPKCRGLKKSNIIIIIAGAVVPGKYLGGNPISKRETLQIAEKFEGTTILGGPAGRFGFFDSKTSTVKKIDAEVFHHICEGDIDACFFDFMNTDEFSDRQRTLAEQNSWALGGAEVAAAHKNFPDMLIAELESYRGCVRYHTGGCSFCMEPSFGEPQFRGPEEIIQEVQALKNYGVRHFRLGGQSCIYSYKAEGVGSSENPEPNPNELERVLRGIRNVIGPDGIFHVDNANPAVLAEYPEQSAEITKYLVKYCTDGNVVAFGMESADPEVIKANNLNASPGQVLAAIKLVNQYGKERGPKGLPKLLPGLNFIAGLKGERPETYGLNLEFLRDVAARGLLLRRINLRQVAMIRTQFKSPRFRKEFQSFKSKLREEIDRPMLEQVVPVGTVMRDVITELHDGSITFGRQLGTYPILVGISYKLPLGRILDMYITGHGYRSITGVEYPFPINSASLNQLKALPGLGARRAARVVRERPYAQPADLVKALDDSQVAEGLLEIVTFEKSPKAAQK